jgi:hypothetical protein
VEISEVPDPLQDRLGHEATAGLIEPLADAREEWTAEMIERVGDRFERRLTDEITKVRVEMVQGFAALRQEMTEGLSQLRQEMTAGFASIRQEMADMRFELLKWTFVFWAGPAFRACGFLAVLLRFTRPGA